MDQVLQDRIFNDFPDLFSEKDANMMVTCMCWGIETGPGWYQLIYDLSKEIEQERLKLPKEEQQYTKVKQIKEKYGTLRYYLSSETDEMSYLIREYEDKSSKTCETCGEPGELRGYGWLFTACKEHSKQELTQKAYIEKFYKGHPKKEFLSNRFYFITRWFQYPRLCLNDLKQDLKWNWWKLKRKVKRVFR